MLPKGIPRRKIAEWRCLLELEREYRVLIVEGDCDRRFVETLLRIVGCTKVAAVVPVGDIDIDLEAMATDGWNRGSCQHRVMYFCQQVGSAELGNGQLHGLADLDWLKFIPTPKRAPQCVLFTDFNSLELYAFRPDWLHKFTKFHFKYKDSGNDLMKAVSSASYELFRIRLANEHLAWGMQEKQFHRYLSISKGTVVLDVKNYVRALLQDKDNDKWGSREIFEAKRESLSIADGDDMRHWMRGHDFTFLLMWYLRERMGSEFPYRSCDENCHACFEGALLCAVEYSFTNEMRFLATLNA